MFSIDGILKLIGQLREEVEKKGSDAEWLKQAADCLVEHVNEKISEAVNPVQQKSTNMIPVPMQTKKPVVQYAVRKKRAHITNEMRLSIKELHRQGVSHAEICRVKEVSRSSVVRNI